MRVWRIVSHEQVANAKSYTPIVRFGDVQTESGRTAIHPLPSGIPSFPTTRFASDFEGLKPLLRF